MGLPGRVLMSAVWWMEEARKLVAEVADSTVPGTFFSLMLDVIKTSRRLIL
jgi:hypothetical protein